jgi:Coenzyme PQQ synthesis protein D (PqqD)
MGPPRGGLVQVPERRYRIHGDAVIRPDGTSAVVLHLGTNQYYELNATARFVWETLAPEGATAGELASSLAASFDVDPAEAEALVAELLSTFEAERLVEVPSAGLRDRVRRRLFG